MSRSKPSAGGPPSPVAKYFQMNTGGDGYGVTWYDKDTDTTVHLGTQFQFLLLDELATVEGWSDATNSGIWSNEVRDTRTEPFTVRSFTGNAVLVQGTYAQIKEKLAILGGRYAASIYFAYIEKDLGALRIGHFKLKGTALSSWMDFKQNCPASGGVKDYYTEAVRIVGFKPGKKGSVRYATPQFELARVGDAAKAQAVALDKQLQEYLENRYSSRTTVDTSVAREPGSDDALGEDDIPY